MLPIGWLVIAVVLAILLTMWVTFTLTRLDRLHARVAAAQAALDAQLVRRAAALQHVAESAGSRLAPEQRAAYDGVAQRAIDAPTEGEARQTLENAVGRAIAELSVPLDRTAIGELREAAARVLIARRFYNDAVRDTRALRARRMPRALRLAGHAALPDFFDIDDTLPPDPDPEPGDARLPGETRVVVAPGRPVAPQSTEQTEEDR